GAFSVNATHLGDGDYKAKASQTDGAGNEDNDIRAFTVDTDTPDAPVIQTNPDDPTNATTADFTFDPSEDVVRLECKLDGGSYEEGRRRARVQVRWWLIGGLPKRDQPALPEPDRGVPHVLRP